MYRKFLSTTLQQIYNMYYPFYNCSDKVLIEWRWKYKVVSEGKGRLFRRKDGKYLIYIPKSLAEDSMFPWRGLDTLYVKVSFKPDGAKRLVIEEWKEPQKQ